jgi:hypothetical protein
VVLRPRKITALLGGSLLVVAALALGTGTASAADGDPPGNNGTIKIDGEPFDSHPDNQPHVGCVFQVDFYGFDEGGNLFADVTFETQSPTPPGPNQVVLLTDKVFIGEDPAGGGIDLDASETYTLDFTGITPQPNQGFHVKLTINADGSQGADTKHKVFWVTGCGETESPPPSTSTPPTTSTPPPTSTPPTTTTPGVPTSPAGKVSGLPKTGAGFPIGSAALFGILLMSVGGIVLLASQGVIKLPSDGVLRLPHGVTIRLPYRRRH